MASSINASTSGAGGVITTADNTGILNMQTAGTTAVTIDASQNVGIGTSSPSSILSGSNVNLTVEGTNGADISLKRSGGAAIIGLGVTSGNECYLYSTTATPLVFATNSTEQARISSAGVFSFNSGYGSVATAYGCRAWVNFNGTGTVAIRASGNVTSITDNGTGQYTVNFTNAMPDANFCLTGTAGSGTVNDYFLSGQQATPTTTTARVVSYSSGGTAVDLAYINVAIFR